MIVPQVALSLVQLSSGALVVRGIEQLLRADPGFRSDGVFAVRVRTPPEFFPKISDAIVFQHRVQNALATIPGAPGNTGDGERAGATHSGSSWRSCFAASEHGCVIFASLVPGKISSEPKTMKPLEPH
jgi:hypothetical protein